MIEIVISLVFIIIHHFLVCSILFRYKYYYIKAIIIKSRLWLTNQTLLKLRFYFWVVAATVICVSSQSDPVVKKYPQQFFFYSVSVLGVVLKVEPPPPLLRNDHWGNWQCSYMDGCANVSFHHRYGWTRQLKTSTP